MSQPTCPRCGSHAFTLTLDVESVYWTTGLTSGMERHVNHFGTDGFRDLECADCSLYLSPPAGEGRLRRADVYDSVGHWDAEMPLTIPRYREAMTEIAERLIQDA